MSLWLQSLCPYEIDPNWDRDRLDKQVLRILRHVAMPVPRSWWEGVLSGRLSDHAEGYARLFRSLLAELHKIPDRFGTVTLAHLIALAFTDEGYEELDEQTRKLPVVEAVNFLLTKAGEALRGHPAAGQLAEQLESLPIGRQPEEGKP
jgi:hypothetical protein